MAGNTRATRWSGSRCRRGRKSWYRAANVFHQLITRTTSTRSFSGSFITWISHLIFSDPTSPKLIADLFHQFRPTLINITHLIPRQHGIQHYPMTHKSISRRVQTKPFSPTLHSIQPYRILCSRPHTLTYHLLPKDVYSTRVRLYVCLCAPRYAAPGRNMTGIHPRSQK